MDNYDDKIQFLPIRLKYTPSHNYSFCNQVNFVLKIKSRLLQTMYFDFQQIDIYLYRLVLNRYVITSFVHF